MTGPQHPTPREQPGISDRRRFFRLGLSKAFGSLSEMVEQICPLPLPQLRPALRPPGALAEKEFLRTCYRCGACVDACGVRAIQNLQVQDDEIGGTPFIDPDLKACTLCERLSCMAACPSGALRRTRRDRIRMGVAGWSADACVHTSEHPCLLCVERCPVGGTALRATPQGTIQVTAANCAGCGVCQQVCPARPKAMRVEPL